MIGALELLGNLFILGLLVFPIIMIVILKSKE